jgi:hypothetical protein
MYKVDSMGYFGGVSKVSRGPWFRQMNVEDDGLEYFYQYRDHDNKELNLLSNNLAVGDREALSRIYFEHRRTNLMAWAAGAYLGFETVFHVPALRAMAPGYRFLAMIGCGMVYKTSINFYWSMYTSPVMGAFLRKYNT